MAASSPESVAREIRKLRKKLRQIENLERLDRSLSDEEIAKVLNKNILRERLQKLLLSEHGQQWSSRKQTSAEADADTSTSFTSDVSITADIAENRTEICNEEHDKNFSSRQNVVEDVGDRSAVESKIQEDKSYNLLDSVKKETKVTDRQTEKPPPEKQSPKHQKSKDAKPPDQLKTARQKWQLSFCLTSELDGHNDIVTALSVDGDTLITASRDTTVKVWSLSEGRELRSLGGHTGSVTCVMIMSSAASSAYAEAKNVLVSGQLVISGSVDCSYNVWSIQSGEILQSVYTFNPVAKLTFNQDNMVITGTDGGKLELWDLVEGSNKQSSCVHNEAITGLKMENENIYSSSADGVIKIHVVRQWQLSCVFVSENVRSTSGMSLTPRNIHSFDVSDQKIFFGDDAVNIKVLDWKKGVARKLPNHTEDFASTDALCCMNKLLIASSYDIDVGRSYINIRSLPRGDYLASLDDEKTNRILCVSCTKLKSGNTLVISGGDELKLWEILPHRPDGDRYDNDDDDGVSLLQPKYLSSLARPGQDSDEESEAEVSEVDDDDDDDDDDVDDDVSDVGGAQNEQQQSNNWLSWCVLL